MTAAKAAGMVSSRVAGRMRSGKGSGLWRLGACGAGEELAGGLRQGGFGAGHSALILEQRGGIHAQNETGLTPRVPEAPRYGVAG